MNYMNLNRILRSLLLRTLLALALTLSSLSLVVWEPAGNPLLPSTVMAAALEVRSSVPGRALAQASSAQGRGRCAAG